MSAEGPPRGANSAPSGGSAAAKPQAWGDHPSAGLKPALDLVLVWHMHQPDYRDPLTGEYRLPWVYLHALKDYSDMAAHLEACPKMRAVVNLVPILLDQLEDYAEQLASGKLRDPLLRLLAKPAGSAFNASERAYALTRCFPDNLAQLVAPYPAYAALHRLAQASGAPGADGASYLSDRYFTDLVIWYHLAWTGETVRRTSPLPGRLMARGANFDEPDRAALFELVRDVVSGIIPRYRLLEESGQIEISTSPHTHPLSPLLIDFAAAREARPDLPLPNAERYPGGAERVAAQLESAAASHARRFGRRPDGLWPSEGAVSDAFATIAAKRGVRWIASGSQVLDNSLRSAQIDGEAPEHRFRPYRVDTAPEVVCFFRDDQLSDLIGFEYRKWNSGDAAKDFVRRLEALAGESENSARPVVTVIVDGENAWEHYPYNGYFFLHELYERLGDHPSIRSRTCRDIAADRERISSLPHLVAGSWVYGDLTTWIGVEEKNLAWDLLVDAKRAFDAAHANGPNNDGHSAARERLAACESSDWFWWFGDHHPPTAVASFDALFRLNLRRLYELVGVAPPAALDQPVSRGGSSGNLEGAMRRTTRN